MGSWPDEAGSAEGGSAGANLAGGLGGASGSRESGGAAVDEAPASTSAEDLLASFARWAADERALEATRSRRRVVSLREQAAGSATLTGTLVDLAERDALVVLSGPNLHLAGRLVGVGEDFFTLSQTGGGLTLVSNRAVSTVRPEGRAQGAGQGDRGAPLSLDMAAALAWLAEERSPVRLVLAGGERLEGELVAVGVDVLTVRTGLAGSRQMVLVAVAAVEACTAV
ncbi:MAG: hypothetical protein ACRDYC_02360 [Acidimicrobiales bacterium]